MTATSPIVISGSIAIDRIMGFDGRYGDHIHPEKLHTLSVSFFLNALQDSYGGVGANIAYSLALLGHSPILLGAVGPDAGKYIDKLSKHGVDTQHIFKSRAPTASFNVMTDSDQNQIGGFYPGAMLDSHTLSLEPWRHQNPIVVVSPHDPAAMKRQVEECRLWGLRLLYDIGQQVTTLPAEDISVGLDAADVLILNDYEMGTLSSRLGRSVDSIKARVPVVVTTLGKNGSIIEGATVPNRVEIGVVEPSRVIDPTGAGDAYRAGLLYGLSRSWDLQTSAQLGAVCAAYAVEQSGTQNHVFTFAGVANRYQQAFGQLLPLTKQESLNAKN